MTLLTRLIAPQELGGGVTEVKLPVHQFLAALAEVRRGEVTRAQLIAGFSLDASEEEQLDTFISRMAADSISREEVHDVLMLAENGFRTPAQVLTRLGF